jgi:hypothetical protein
MGKPGASRSGWLDNVSAGEEDPGALQTPTPTPPVLMLHTVLFNERTA